MALILAIEDDADVRRSLKAALAKRSHELAEAETAEAGLELLETQAVEAVILDLTLQGMDGMAALAKIKELDPTLPVLMLTASSSVPNVVLAMKLGAEEYLVKPFSNTELTLAVDKVLRNRSVHKEVEALRLHVRRLRDAKRPVGLSTAIRSALEKAGTVAPTDLTVIIEGPSGSGKEVFAHLLHDLSPRAHSPFVALDCGALPENLVESELFGYEKGAFTGADRKKPGLFELAYKGTLFLDEITNLSLGVQAKLLRALQESRIRRLGAKKDLPVDVRVLAATNQPLAEAVSRGRFREDLFHRLDQFRIELPPLARRTEDIPELARSFLAEANKLLKKTVKDVSPAALEALARHDWPGNVRELRNVVIRAALLAGDAIEPQHLELSKTAASNGEPLDLKGAVRGAVETVERRLIRAALLKTGDNRAAAAKLLGIDRKALYEKLARYQLG